LEDIVPLEEPKEGEEQKNTVEEVSRRIQIIQKELEKEKISEEERAFTEAAEEHYDAFSVRHAYLVSGGKRK